VHFHTHTCVTNFACRLFAELAIATRAKPMIDTCEDDDVRQTIDTCNMSP